MDPVSADFDAVAITALAATEDEVIRLAARYRAFGTKVLVGGLGATLNPQAFYGKVDVVVLGEGEVVWPAIVSDLQAGALKCVYRASEYPHYDLAQSPIPAFDRLDRLSERRFSVQTERGCPWACDFCAASMRLGSFRTKPIDRVMAELERIHHVSGHTFVEFADDNTFADKQHGRRLLKALADTDFTFFAETDLGVADDAELLQMMRDAGCRQVLIGFESPDYAALDGVEQRSNWKAKRHSRALAAVEKIQSHGIAVVGCFVLGLDGAGPDSFDSVKRFVGESGLFDVQITYLTPFPGTPLYQRLSDDGRMLIDTAPGKYTLFDITFQPDSMSISDLEAGYRGLMTNLYSDEMVDSRRQRFYSHLRSRVLARRHTAN